MDHSQLQTVNITFQNMKHVVATFFRSIQFVSNVKHIVAIAFHILLKIKLYKNTIPSQWSIIINVINWGGLGMAKPPQPIGVIYDNPPTHRRYMRYHSRAMSNISSLKPSHFML